MYSLKTSDGHKNPLRSFSFALYQKSYSDLYKREETDTECVSQLLKQLPTLTKTQSKNLDSSVSFEELTDAVKQMKPGKAPGIDGLSVDFNKALWKYMGKDFYEVVLECFKENAFPQAPKGQY